MRLPALILAVTVWSTASCLPKSEPAHPRPRGQAFTVKIWIQADPRIPRAAVLNGCNKWRTLNVTCVETDDPMDAKIRLRADDGECHVFDKPNAPKPDDDEDQKSPREHWYLAWAHAGGDIRMMMRCLSHSGDKYDEHQFMGVAAHEVGHELGIWRHVPRSCSSEKVKKHAEDDKPICGDAVMNEYYHHDTVDLTEVDAMAFDERSFETSALIGDTPRLPPTCGYE